MYTSCFGNVKNLPYGLIPVAISAGIPPWFKGQRDSRLAPTKAMLGMKADQYETLYNRILLPLDAESVYSQLGNHAVLLCWEKPGEGCHRRVVAEWFESKLGVLVPELGVDRTETPCQTTRHYPFWKTPDVWKALIASRIESARGAAGECEDIHGTLHHATLIDFTPDHWPIFDPIPGTRPTFHVANVKGKWVAVGPRKKKGKVPAGLDELQRELF